MQTTPYKRLRQALKAEIDEDAWASLYRTRSRPFDPPATGTIAVKIINHHRDKVFKTYPLRRSTATGATRRCSSRRARD